MQGCKKTTETHHSGDMLKMQVIKSQLQRFEWRSSGVRGSSPVSQVLHINLVQVIWKLHIGNQSFRDCKVFAFDPSCLPCPFPQVCLVNSCFLFIQRSGQMSFGGAAWLLFLLGSLIVHSLKLDLMDMYTHVIISHITWLQCIACQPYGVPWGQESQPCLQPRHNPLHN